MPPVKVSREHNFRCQVTAKRPVDNGFEDLPIEAEFKCVGLARLGEIQRGGDVALLGEVLARVHGSLEVDGQEISGDELKAFLIDMPYTKTALVSAYFANVTGAAAKN